MNNEFNLSLFKPDREVPLKSDFFKVFHKDFVYNWKNILTSLHNKISYNSIKGIQYNKINYDECIFARYKIHLEILKEAEKISIELLFKHLESVNYGLLNKNEIEYLNLYFTHNFNIILNGAISKTEDYACDIGEIITFNNVTQEWLRASLNTVISKAMEKLDIEFSKYNIKYFYKQESNKTIYIMNKKQHILNLIGEALDDIEKQKLPLSKIITKTVRIANLKDDFENLWWLRWELLNIVEKDKSIEILKDILPHLSKDRFNLLWKKYVVAWAEERRTKEITEDLKIFDSHNIKSLSLEEIEASINQFKALQRPTDDYKTRFNFSFIFTEIDEIINRIKNRVHYYLTNSEKELLDEKSILAIFEKDKKYIEDNLTKLSPETLNQLTTAYERLLNNNPEEFSQSLLTCRRLLKSLADIVYPAKSGKIKCADGKEREIGDEQFINRLWIFVDEKTENNTSGKIIISNLNDLGNRIDKLNSLANKGTHSNVEIEEAEQCFKQIFLLFGDILRIYENISAIEIDKNNLEVNIN